MAPGTDEKYKPVRALKNTSMALNGSSKRGWFLVHHKYYTWKIMECVMPHQSHTQGVHFYEACSRRKIWMVARTFVFNAGRHGKKIFSALRQETESLARMWLDEDAVFLLHHILEFHFEHNCWVELECACNDRAQHVWSIKIHDVRLSLPLKFLAMSWSCPQTSARSWCTLDGNR